MPRRQVDFTDTPGQREFDRVREQSPGKTLTSPSGIDAGPEFGAVAMDCQMHESGDLAVVSRCRHADVLRKVDACNVRFDTVI